MANRRSKVLWVGDAACPSGFANVTHEILDDTANSCDVTVLGVNYRGDPHPYPYPIWAAAVAGDFLGIGRLVWMCDLVHPDVIVLLSDGWHIKEYIDQLRLRKSNGEYAWPEHANIPIIAIVAVDGLNFQREWLNGVDYAIFWTQFALDEARASGVTCPASVIPLGVNLEIFKPIDKRVARRTKGVGNIEDAFIVGNVNRNQPRKRWDLTIDYFAEWVHGGRPVSQRREEATLRVKDAYLFLHSAPTGDMGIHVHQLASYYKIVSRIRTVAPPAWYGVPAEEMAVTYNCFDVAVSTTQGEGFGLTTLEAMACGIPVVVPEWSGLGDWTKGAAWLIPCTSTAIGPPFVNVIGGVPDKEKFVLALDALYHNRDFCEINGKAAIERAQQERFRWSNIGAAHTAIINAVIERSSMAGEETQVAR